MLVVAGHQGDATTRRHQAMDSARCAVLDKWATSLSLPWSPTRLSEPNLLPLPAGASAALVKPTKYHYYPHNQHIYLLPECAIQQVCNAVYVRLNWTQPLCACPSRYRDPCSASLNSDDLHTTELMTDRNSRKALTLVKTCEPTAEMRLCRSPRDWSLLALQNVRSGKSHYLVICRCPDSSILEGPMSHDQPTYASVPGIRVFGMMCVDGRRGKRQSRLLESLEAPRFPVEKISELLQSASWATHSELFALMNMLRGRRIKI
nr:uncharacterized protein LOC111505944 [Leptinotarsa decemlineata]